MEFQIVDYTSTHLITVNNGQSKVQDGTFKIIHPINLRQYDDFVRETQTYINQNIPKNNPFYPILKEEIMQTLDLIQSIAPFIDNQDNKIYDNTSSKNNSIGKGNLRNKRSFNVIGTAWKYIAGTPDHDDFEMLEFNMNELNDNNNKQVIVNQVFNDRLNNVTRIINEMSNAISKDNYLINEIVLTLQNRVRLIKEQVINLNYAVQWAKSGIINSMILSKLEIRLALEKLKEERMPFASTEEAVEYAKVNVMYNNSMILYVIKIPLSNEKIYENFLLYPVKKNGKIVKLLFNEIIKNSNEIFGIKNNCLKYNSVKICNNDQLIDLSNDTCIPNIIKGISSSCTYSNSQHVPSIENILPGVILLNEYNDTIIIDNAKRHLSGTFLIKFTNTTIAAQNQVYRNLEAPQIKTIPAVLQPTPLEKNLENLVTIESLNELHLNNSHEIKKIKMGTVINGVSTMVFLLLLVVIGSIILHLFKLSRRINVAQINMEEAHLPSGPAVILTNVQPRNIMPASSFRMNDIPYF